MYKINSVYLVVIFSSCLLSATALASGKQEKKSTIEELGEDIGKTAKKIEHGYKKHIVEPTRDFTRGVKEGEQKQKRKGKREQKQEQEEKDSNKK
jgi:hypothetical protein